MKLASLESTIINIQNKFQMTPTMNTSFMLEQKLNCRDVNLIYLAIAIERLQLEPVDAFETMRPILLPALPTLEKNIVKEEWIIDAQQGR